MPKRSNKKALGIFNYQEFLVLVGLELLVEGERAVETETKMNVSVKAKK